MWNPSTGEVQAEVALGDAALLDRAVDAARAVQPEWAMTNPQKRARIMFAFKQLVEANRDELAHLLASEHGKVIDDAQGDIQRGLEVIEFCCGIPHVLKGEYTQGAGPGIDVYSMRQPLGIGAGITPFNFPGMIPMWMFGTAIATGNAFILKPSERDPSVPVRLAELMLEAGAPAGILQVVHGDKEMVDAILEAAEENKVDAIGMSGLLVKSTVVMKDNLQEMNDRGVAQKYPVLLGGAALTRSYVENDLGELFQGDVRYAKDAFEGLRLMDSLMAVKRGEVPAEQIEEDRAKDAERRARHQRSKQINEARRAREDLEPVVGGRSDVATDNPVPTPPFWGSRVSKGISLADYSSWLDERALFYGSAPELFGRPLSPAPYAGLFNATPGPTMTIMSGVGYGGGSEWALVVVVSASVAMLLASVVLSVFKPGGRLLAWVD